MPSRQLLSGVPFPAPGQWLDACLGPQRTEVGQRPIPVNHGNPELHPPPPAPLPAVPGHRGPRPGPGRGRGLRRRPLPPPRALSFRGTSPALAGNPRPTVRPRRSSSGKPWRRTGAANGAAGAGAGAGEGGSPAGAVASPHAQRPDLPAPRGREDYLAGCGELRPEPQLGHGAAGPLEGAGAPACRALSPAAFACWFSHRQRLLPLRPRLSGNDAAW